MINEYGAAMPATEGTNRTETSADQNKAVIDTVNGLIETCKDGQNGFKDAVEGVNRPELKALFAEFSQQRAEYAGVLQGLVRMLGGDPENSGSFTGDLHRGWMNLKAAISTQEEQSILDECERGEDAAKEAYAKALETTLPANVRDVVGQQSQGILAAHNRIKQLRDLEHQRSASTSSGR